MHRATRRWRCASLEAHERRSRVRWLIATHGCGQPDGLVPAPYIDNAGAVASSSRSTRRGGARRRRRRPAPELCAQLQHAPPPAAISSRATPTRAHRSSIRGTHGGRAPHHLDVRSQKLSGWAVRIGGNGTDRGMAAAGDGVVVTGTFSSTAGTLVSDAPRRRVGVWGNFTARLAKAVYGHGGPPLPLESSGGRDAFAVRFDVEDHGRRGGRRAASTGVATFALAHEP